jgi:hypothetical protein
VDTLPPPIDAQPTLSPVPPPPGSPDALRRAGGPQGPTAPSADPAPAPARPLVAVLEFDARQAKTVLLDFPFQFDGRRHTEITVRRLLTCQVAELCVGGRVPEPFDVYAVMTGIPAPVLRGLDADDGQAVAEAAFDFLPRLLRDAFSG